MRSTYMWHASKYVKGGRTFPAPLWSASMLEVPQPLVDAVLAGRCVAFVGAGFSATVVPTWERLLERLAEEEDVAEADRVAMRELFVAGGQLANEAAAQFLVERMGAERFEARLISLVARPEVNERQRRRVQHLLGVPFRGVLTTNFDGVLEGVVPGRDGYRHILRPDGGSGWYQDRYWHGAGPTVVKLHGDAVTDPGTIVLTRRDYRERLYGKSAYATFLRAVFATNTMLFLGCSFNDPYLNELRSEILALLEQRDIDQPLAYAVIPDQPAARVAFFRQHEGMQLLSYETSEHPDHAPFDAFLEQLYGRTSPIFHLGRLLGGRRILWLDPNPDSTEKGIELLRRAAGLAEAGFALTEVADLPAAIAAVRAADDAAEPFDLVISHWGHDDHALSKAEQLLASMRTAALGAPVIVFASGDYAEANKRRALRAGAIHYCYRWSTLFRRLADVFDDGLKTG